MAKKLARQHFGLDCSVCKAVNYVTEKNTTKTKDKMTLNKFCNTCRKVTEHNETKLK